MSAAGAYSGGSTSSLAARTRSAAEGVQRRTGHPRALSDGVVSGPRWPPPGYARITGGVRLGLDDPHRSDVLELQARHVAFARAHTPPESVHALDPAALADAALSVYGARSESGRLLAIAAIKHLDGAHAELKSVVTDAAARRRGIGTALLHLLLDVARLQGYRRVSLETGTTGGFGPARAMYTRAGFTTCDPFGNYTSSPNSVFMTLRLT